MKATNHKKVQDPAVQSLIVLIAENISTAGETPALRHADKALQHDGVIWAIGVLNAVRLIVSDILPGTYTPGVSDDIPEELQDELISVGAKVVTAHGNLPEDLSTLYFSFRDKDKGATPQQWIQAFSEVREDEARVGETLPKLQLVSMGRRVCRALVGVDNRIGLLAELNALLIARHNLGAPKFLARMQAIAKHALAIDGEEDFIEIIEQYLINNDDPMRLPSPKHVACMAIVNGVSEVCSECLAHNWSDSPANELQEALASTSKAVDIVLELLSATGDDGFIARGQSLPIYQKRAEAELSGDMSPFRAHLDGLGIDVCLRRIAFIRHNEGCPLLSEIIEEDVLDHFPALKEVDLDKYSGL